MLNIFPIQFLAPLAYALLRLCVGWIFVHLGMNHFKNRESLAPNFNFSLFPFPRFIVAYMSIIELVIGVLFIAGYLTQIAALLAIVLSLKCLLMYSKITHPLIPSRIVYTLILFASISLFITGAGVFALDLPI